MNCEKKFRDSLIWNDDKTACFDPKEFSSAVKRPSRFLAEGYCIRVYLKNGKGFELLECTKEEAKDKLYELMGEIERRR